MSATRFGVGLTTLIVHRKVVHPPHIMSSTSLPNGTTSIAIGMGLGNIFDDDFLENEVVNSNIPLVLDADALSNKLLVETIKQLNREIVVTPHPKEFSKLWRLLTNEKISVGYIQKNRFEVAREFGKNFPNIVLVLKGANPIIAKGDELYLNPIGKNRLAKGGSGDVLSGLIASLLAQGYSSISSAINGSLALAIASNKFEGNNYSLTPLDIIDNLKFI